MQLFSTMHNKADDTNFSRGVFKLEIQAFQAQIQAQIQAFEAQI